ncbi:MAG: exodeoxyribonuclease III [Polyangiaceae bacterium]
MKIATWNVNGIRARFEDVVAFADEHRPDVMCLQEIKALPSQVPEPLTGLPAFHSHWHGGPGGYSGVSLHLSRAALASRPTITIPEFDVETRIAVAELDALTIASIYVPNGNKDYPAKITFLEGLLAWAEALAAAGRPALLCGDFNVTRSDQDLHETHRKRGAIGQRKEERALMARLLDAGYTDASRHFFPDDDTLFTWWPPWREEKQKNRGWRIDYVLVSASLVPALRSATVLVNQGTSDHAPLVVDLDLTLEGSSAVR